jgi:hypothetical protein
MNMSGERDTYVIARRVLLDALDALQDHRNAVILVGAQAIYLHTGDADLAVAPFTADADLALDPSILAHEPALETAMKDAGFTPKYGSDRKPEVGIWKSAQSGMTVDLLVPATVGGPGRRSARLEGHGARAARKAIGLEAALVDKQEMIIAALEAADPRRIKAYVAGPGALLVAKLHKIGERQQHISRLEQKDALDVYRLLRAIPLEALSQSLEAVCQNAVSKDVSVQAIRFLRELFSSADALGSRLAAQAVGTLEDPDVIASSCAVLAEDVLKTIQP